MLGVGALFLVGVIVICCTHWLYQWRNPKYEGLLLPPGSMGLPIIGETLQLFFRSYTMDLHPFFKKRIQRYGPIFRTNLVGRPVVVSADPELNSRIIQGDGKIVEVNYMDAFDDVISIEGETGLGSTGQIHKYIRNLPMNYLGKEKLKDNLLPQIEKVIDTSIRIWSNQASVEVNQASETTILNFIAKLGLGYDAEKSAINIIEKIRNVTKSIMSVPVKIPGTTYYKCLKDRKEVLNVLKDMLNERRSSPEAYRGDFLDQAISDLDTQAFLTEEFFIKLFFGLLMAGSTSTSGVLAVAFNLLAENPSVWKELEAENEALLKRRENADSPLTWDEYKSLTFTHQVMNEVLRFTNLAPGVLRRAIKDIHVKGYTIPAGWSIMVLTHTNHLNANVYKDPFVFNPWRWKDLEPSIISKNFMPFGGGSRQCVGAEFSKAFLVTFLHVLATKYRWTKIKGGNFYRNPFIGFGDGIHIKFMEKRV